MTAPYQNEDGLTVKFASYYRDPKNFVNRPRYIAGKGGVVKEIVIDYDLVQLGADGVSYTSDLNNDGTRDGFNTGDVCLPPHASVLRATMVATETAAGGTSVALGTFGLTGTAIDADGIITAIEGVTANMAVGERVFGNGAYVAATAGTASIGSAAGYLALTAVGTFTAGKGQIVIEYLDPYAAA